MGLLLLCTAPYSLLIFTLVRWHAMSSCTHLELWVLLPLHPYCQSTSWSAACSLHGTGRMLCQAKTGSRWQQGDSASIRHSLTSALSAFPLPGVSPQSQIFMPLIHLVKLTPFLKSPDDVLVTVSSIWKLSYEAWSLFISCLKLPAFGQTPSQAALWVFTFGYSIHIGLSHSQPYVWSGVTQAMLPRNGCVNSPQRKKYFSIMLINVISPVFLLLL